MAPVHYKNILMTRDKHFNENMNRFLVILKTTTCFSFHSGEHPEWQELTSD